MATDSALNGPVSAASAARRGRRAGDSERIVERILSVAPVRAVIAGRFAEKSDRARLADAGTLCRELAKEGADACATGSTDPHPVPPLY